VWLTHEDLIAAGVAFTVTQAAKTFNPRLGNKFSTYLFDTLENFFKTGGWVGFGVFLSEPMRAKERWEGSTISYESGYIRLSSGRVTTVEKYVARSSHVVSHEDLVVYRIDAERAFGKVYAAASPLLRKYLIRWLLQPKVTKFMNGIAYRAAKHEFRTLAKIHILSYPVCQFIINDDVCRKNLCRMILRRGFLTYRHKKVTGRLKDCLEWSLVPLVAH
jgi:hypothetical protein